MYMCHIIPSFKSENIFRKCNILFIIEGIHLKITLLAFCCGTRGIALVFIIFKTMPLLGSIKDLIETYSIILVYLVTRYSSWTIGITRVTIFSEI